MWTEASMSFGDSLLVSLFGIFTVFLMLFALLAAILVISWLVRRAAGDTGGKALSGQEPRERKENGLEEAKLMAVLMAVLSEETGTEPQNLRIKSIRKIDG